ncbi:MAG: dockerin type I domain-containing protein [Patescibacteria group bacterium]
MKKFLYLILLLPLFFFFASPTQAATIFSDDFTATDGTELQTYNSDYEYPYSGILHINNNHLDSGNYFGPSNVTLGDYCASFDFVPHDNNGLIVVRANMGTDQGYYGQLHASGNYELRRWGDILDSGNVSLSEGAHNIKLCADGSDLTFYIDGNLTASAEDSTWSSGKTYFYNDNGYYDNIFTTYYSDNVLIEDLPESTVILASPSTGTKTVGSPFTVNVSVAGDEAFNAARATVEVSENLTVNSISNPTSNACNLHYTTTPTKENPSFAGGIFGDSSEDCTVYSMVVTPNAEGTGTITFTNGSVKAYDDNGELLTGATNASFTLTDGPTPTPTAMLEFSVTSPIETYLENFTITGTKLSTITSIFINGEDTDSTYPTDTTWEVPVTLNLGENNFTIYGSDGTNQTATQTVTVDRHTLGDINGDGEIDLIDASLFAIDWDKTEGLTYILSDMNGDNSVDLTDLSILAKLQ